MVITVSYTRQDIINKCRLAFEDIKTFYKQSFINYGGKTADTNEFYGEVMYVEIDEKLRESLLLAQDRQKMTNA